MALVTATRRLVHVTLRESSRRAAVISAASLPTQSRATCLQRGFTTSTQPLRSDNKVTVHFINRDGEKITVKGSPGDSLLDVVIDQDLDFDGFGACEGTLACSTCHLIFEEEVYKQLGPVTDEEMDMLDLAYGLTDTSRLGCQICLTKSLEGMVARVPESVSDIRQSGDGSS
ncbi:adrenodoxin-like [Myripristis murdjan]|uniref:adrenodoxin-like n=1 Tax=Myripristis murdjan TaxID=586833 RepID=UPI001175CCB5|nr:adrenodoxin-like [Myripristis murdjan]